jgi:geranylgeranyl diphosphate synthase type II
MNNGHDTVAAVSSFPEGKRGLVDGYLAQIDFAAVPAVDGLLEAMRYSLLAGGKRVRPVLALSTAHALGHDPSVVMPYAAALELIHTYSLIHDDLPAMDDDDLRRGKPTCHVAFGENVAILAGDALFAEALRLITSKQGGEPQRVIEALDELLAAIGAGGMVGGQFIDIDQQVGSTDALKQMHALKTGRLVGASVRGSAIVLGAPTSQVERLGQFADELGVLFQIVDDILDVTGSSQELGKPSGSDQRHGKTTYVSAFGLDGARDLAEQSYASVRELLDSIEFRGDADDLRAVSAYIHGRDR